MRIFNPLLYLCFCIPLLVLSGCGEGKNTQTAEKNTVLETYIQPIAIENDAIDTRFGKVDITSDAPNVPADTLKVNGQEVFRAKAFYLSLHQYIRQGQRDVVLFGSNCGDTSCPQTQFYGFLLAIDAKPQILTQENFTAKAGELTVKADGEKILLDLGFNAGKHKSAVLDGEKLSINLETVPEAFIGEEQCQWLYTDALNACKDYHEVDEKCTEPQTDFTEYLQHGMTVLVDIPGYKDASFERYCANACATQQTPDYEAFAMEVCSK
jgi:hypothetical protein